MFSHIFVSVTDFDRALRFYKPLMAALDVEFLIHQHAERVDD